EELELPVADGFSDLERDPERGRFARDHLFLVERFGRARGRAGAAARRDDVVEDVEAVAAELVGERVEDLVALFVAVELERDRGLARVGADVLLAERRGIGVDEIEERLLRRRPNATLHRLLKRRSQRRVRRAGLRAPARIRARARARVRARR